MMPEPLTIPGPAQTPVRPFPWFCPRCRRKEVRRTTVPYQCPRIYHGQPITVVVAKLTVPRCENCGELVFDYEAEEQLNQAYEEQTKALMNGNGSSGSSCLANGTTPYHAAFYAHELT